MLNKRLTIIVGAVALAVVGSVTATALIVANGPERLVLRYLIHAVGGHDYEHSYKRDCGGYQLCATGHRGR